MDFRTIIPIKKYEYPMDYQSEILLIGSCFAENMGEKFEYFKFNNTINPFGIIFNPVSIAKLITRAVEKNYYKEADVFIHNNLWSCYEVHSELSNPNKEALLEQLNLLLDEVHFQIFKLTHFQITYGTAWIYRHKESNEIVANCHKVPQNQFEKELLSITEIQKAIQKTIELVHKINPKCQFLFTVSPVRHIKDGFVENQQSKANLIAALHTSISSYPTCNYFPSYEIMMDELRDYRFYAEDMLHPNQVAIDYIWIKFFENYIKPECFPLMNEVCSIQKALQHKPFNPDTENYQKFKDNLEDKINSITKKLPHLKFKK